MNNIKKYDAKYHITPNYSVAFNNKVASSSIAYAIIKDFYPHILAYLGNESGYQSFCPSEKEPSKPVVLVVREPVDRFRTAFRQLRLESVDDALYSLENQTQILRPHKRFLYQDPHFTHQHELLKGGTAFRYEDLEKAAKFIGLSIPLPVINKACNDGRKPNLTSDQKSRVLNYYSKDAELYWSLS